MSIQIRNVSKRFGNFVAVNDVSLDPRSSVGTSIQAMRTC